MEQKEAISATVVPQQWSQTGCLKYSWVLGALPMILALAVWQLTVLIKVRVPIQQFITYLFAFLNQDHDLVFYSQTTTTTGETVRDVNAAAATAARITFDDLRQEWFTSQVFVQVVSNLTPANLAAAVLLFAYYLETGNHVFLILSMTPFIVIFIILLVLFAIDFAIGGNQADGIAFIGIGCVCLAPVTAFVFPIRGLTGLPLILTFGAAFLAYAEKTMKLIKTVDDLGAVA